MTETADPPDSSSGRHHTSASRKSAFFGSFKKGRRSATHGSLSLTAAYDGRASGAIDPDMPENVNGASNTDPTVRQSSGFLLDSTWKAARSAIPRRSPITSATAKQKGKGTATSPSPRPPTNGHAISSGGRQLSTDGSPSASPTPARRPHHLNRNDSLPSSSRSNNSARQADSTYSSEAPSRPKTASSRGARNGRISSDSHTSHAAAADHAHLVRMALSLNESRRMHLSPGQIATVETPTGRRAVSMGLPQSASPALNGSYQQHLKDLRHADRYSSSSPASRAASGTRDYNGTLSSASSDRHVPSPAFAVPTLPEFEYHFSPATVARAERAKAYFELCHQYRRVLDQLPPLRQNKARSQDGHLPAGKGRQYNPLQYIRNRKIRTRERHELDGPKSGWADLRNVDAWAEAVVEASQKPGFEDQDTVNLPTWNFQGLAFPRNEPSDSSQWGTPPRDRTQKKTAIDWSFAPADLLADLYWTEDGNNKALLEDHHGDQIFPNFQRPIRDTRSRHANQTSRKVSDETASDDSGPASSPIDRRSPPDAALIDQSSPKHGIFHRRSRVGKFRGHVLGRRRKESINHSDLSNSDDENGGNLSPDAGKVYGKDNFAPLEAHMNKLMEQETAAAKSEKPPSRGKPSIDGHNRRVGISGDPRQDHFDPNSAESAMERIMTVDDSYRPDRNSTASGPRISIEQYGDDRNSQDDSPNTYQPGTIKRLALDGQVERHSNRRFGFLQRHRSTSDADQEQVLAKIPSEVAEESGAPTSSRSSLNLSSRSNSMTNLQQTGSLSPVSRTQSPNRTLAAKGFFKAGRIGEIVRGERGAAGNDAVRKRTGRHDSISSTISRNDSDNSRSDETSPRPAGRKQRPSDASKRPNMASIQRSRSSTDVREQKTHAYHMDNLPTFVSAKAASPEPNGNARGPRASQDIGKQEQVKALEDRRKSRVQHLAPYSTTANSSDVSPTASSINLSRYPTAVGFDASDPQQQKKRLSRDSSAAQDASRRFSDILREPSPHSRDVRASESRDARAKPRSMSRPGQAHRSWSIATVLPDRKAPKRVTARDLAYVRSLLLSTGVKANAIVHRANEKRIPPSKFLVQAAELCQTSAEPVRRREEHVVAARWLSQDLETSVKEFQHAADCFASGACNKLRDELRDLQERANSRLTPQVRTIDEDAEAFIARLTTTHTLAIKQVNDNVDQMLRSRRRRLRYLASAGFRALEWTLVGFMWFIWLFVLLLRIVRGAVVGMVKGARWLLWL